MNGVLRFGMPLGILAISFVMLASGCLCSSLGGGQMESITGNFLGADSTSTTLNKHPANASAQWNQTKPVIINNVGKALFMWTPFECNYTNQKTLGETVRTQMWMNEGKYHAVVSYGMQHKTHVINDGVDVYVWEEGKSSMPGSRYEIAEITGLAGQIESKEVDSNKTVAIYTDLLDIMTAKDVKCIPARIPADMFTPPPKTHFDPKRGVYDYEYDSKLEKYTRNLT